MCGVGKLRISFPNRDLPTIIALRSSA